MARDVQAFLKLARDRFHQAAEATEKQRRRELDDLAFYAGGDNQWDPETLKARQAQGPTDGMPPVPARPCLTINKVREPVHQVLNQERLQDLTIELIAADDFGGLVGPTDTTELQLREGLVRRIQRESDAADARTWAFDRAVKAGTGFYLVSTRYLPGQTWDQEVFVQRIFNQASVSLDPFHEQPDGSDAEWGFIGGDMPWLQYQAEFPRAARDQPNVIAHADDSEFRALGEDYPGWFSSEGNTRSARVVEYFYTERTTRVFARLADGSSAWKDELPDEAVILEERPIIQKAIRWAKIDAVQILDETDLPASNLGIIKVLGEELQPYDQERRVEGMVRPARSAGEGFNAMASKLVETVGLTPIPPFQIAEGQVETYEKWYQAANTRTLPYLPYRTKDLEGTIVGKPERTPVDTPIQAIAAAIQMFDEAIKSTTMVPAVQLGEATDRHLKAKGAIKLLQDQASVGTSHFLDNLRRSVRYEGQCINSRLYPIYGTPGRMVRILAKDGSSQIAQIGPVPPGQSSGRPGMLPPKTYALTEAASVNVVVKLTRSFDSRAQEEATTIGTMLEANPALMTWFGDLFFKNQDGPGHEEMADRAKLMLDPRIQQLLQSKAQGETIPPAVQAELAHVKGQLQQAEQILMQAKRELESKEAERRAEQMLKLRLAEVAHDQAIELQRMKDATALEVARISAAKQVADAQIEAEEEAIALAQKIAHETTEAALQRDHEARLAAEARGHQTALAAAAHATRSIALTRGPKGDLLSAELSTPSSPSREPAP